MKTIMTFFSLALAASVAIHLPLPSRAAVADTRFLTWDADARQYTTKPGERYADFKFWFTNTTAYEISILSAVGSCSCTKAELPQTPWVIRPGTNGVLDVKTDLAGKSGTVTKSVTVTYTGGTKTLQVTSIVTPGGQTGPSPHDEERLKNMQTALADRQVVFKNAECASCHADPAKGRTDGAQLYFVACANCHDSANRASTVPDLRALKHPTDADHWRKWIAYGRAGSMMPAFAQSESGPLNQQQIEAIVGHLVKTIPGQARAAGQSVPSSTVH